MDRLDYILRRLLLMIPTFIGITFFSFGLCQFVPGGPVEQVILQMRGVGSGSGDRMSSAAGPITAEQRKALEKHFGFDKPLPQRYWKWLVHDRIGLAVESYKYPNQTVWQLIVKRFPVSLVFGITGFVLTYLVCIPLGIAKALRHGGTFDLASSLIVFIGYAIPPFAFGMVLKVLFSGVTETFWDIFPVSGFHSSGFAAMSFGGKAKDLFQHMFLPVLCYMVGNFAVLTLLMKNSLLEQIGQDYIRTVLARGATRTRAIWGHAFRNALIPIATGFGGILTIMFAGSVLIERVFEIPGMGRLSLDAIVSRDYMVFMGILSATAILGLLGRLLSDFCYLLIDPRISFRNSS
ncbi:MAG: ABC transporter permease subunit [Kiritimatiellae bacterium]|nr:ABC transporter permease subunit [Kiritimatiellia bacterium]